MRRNIKIINRRHVDLEQEGHLSVTKPSLASKRNVHSRKLTIHNESSSNAILSSFLKQKYGSSWNSRDSDTSFKKLNRSMNFVTKRKQEIKFPNEPLPFFPKYVENNVDELTSTTMNIRRQKFSPKYKSLPQTLQSFHEPGATPIR